MAMRYAVCVKTVYDPLNGLDIKSFGSKSQYLADPRTHIKVMSIVPLDTGVPMSFHGDDAVRTALGALAAVQSPTPPLWVTHTTFHVDAIQARVGMTLPGAVVLVDELVRQQNPAQRGVSLPALLDAYLPGTAQKPCNLQENNHTLAELTARNEWDASLIAGLYLRITGER